MEKESRGATKAARGAQPSGLWDELPAFPIPFITVRRMPKRGFGRCDGHQETGDFGLKKSPAWGEAQ
jgi:hypothetical protein